MIELSGIARTYVLGGRPLHALRNANLTIKQGEYLSIMGPSGSGKSTLLNLLGCLDRPTAGTYRFGKEETSSMTEAQLSRLRRDQIGFVFQFFHLVPRLTAAANVELPMVFAGAPPQERAERVRKALEGVGLTLRADHRPDQLSGGEQQRVAIARAVVMNPPLLLADEPTGNLDSASGREIISLIEGMNERGLTLIVVTHDPKIGERARRQIRLSDGEIISDELRDNGSRSLSNATGESARKAGEVERGSPTSRTN